MDVPQLTIYPNLKRVIIPKTIFLLFLGSIFYFGIRLNAGLLGWRVEPAINILIIFVLVLLIAGQIMLTFFRIKKISYLFYPDHIQSTGRKQFSIYYLNLSDVDKKKNFIDTIFNTGTVRLSKLNRIPSIDHPDKVYDYLIRLIQYNSSDHQNTHNFK